METIYNRRSTKSFTKLIAVSVGHFFTDLYMGLIPPILFLFARSMGMSLTQQAFIVFVIASCGSFAQPLIGFFVDKRGKTWLIILALSWIAFWMSITGIINNYYLLIFAVGVGALASALFHPLGIAMVALLGEKSIGKSLSVFMTIGFFATSVSPVIAIPIVEKYGLWALTLFMIPGFLIALFMFLAQLHKIEMNKTQKIKKEEYVRLNLKSAKWITALVYIASNKALIRSFLTTFGIQIMIAKQMDIKVAGVVLSVYLLASSFGIIVGGFLNDKIGSKKVLILFNLLALLCMVTIIFTSGIPMVLGFMSMGLALGGSNTSNIVMTHELMPDKINVATGLIMGLAGGLGGLIMLLFGKIGDMQGLIISTAYLLMPLLLATIVTFFLPNSRAANT